MAKYVIDETTLTGLANEVRTLTGTTNKMKPSEMVAALKNVDASGAYDEGYADGKQAEYDRLVDPTKIIEKTVSGSVIRVDDVSEIPHKCTVSVDKDASVSVCGKSLLNITGREVSTDSNTANTAARSLNGNQLFVGMAASGHLNKVTLDYYSVDDNCVTLKSAYIGYGIGFDVRVKPGVTYTFSCKEKQNVGFTFYDADGVMISNGVTQQTVTFTAPENAKWVIVSVTAMSSGTEFVYTNIQLELGSATEYEPYQVTTHAITAGQTIEVDSICPTMTLFADNDATITFGYHKSWGMQTEYDRFWDAYQQNGNKTNYDQAFAYTHWTDETYNPKYDIVCNGSNSTRQAFYNGRMTSTKVPIRVKNTELNATFTGSSVKTIPLLELDGITGIRNNPFSGCSALENITIEGSIEADISFQWSTKLSNASIWSIAMALAWMNTDAGENNRTLTLSQTAVDNAFPDIDEWESGLLLNIPDNWSITLV